MARKSVINDLPIGKFVRANVHYSTRAFNENEKCMGTANAIIFRESKLCHSFVVSGKNYTNQWITKIIDCK